MLVPQKGRAGADRAARTERALIRLHALILAVLGGLSLVAAGGPGGAPVLAWVSCALWLAVAVDLLARGERPFHLVMLWVALVAGTWAQADLGTGALGLVVGVFGVSAARLLTARAFVAAMVVAAGTSLVVTAITQPADLMVAVDDAVLSVAMTVAIRGLLLIVVGASEQMGAVDRELASARMSEATALAERDAAERAARALHDEVLTALRGIAEGWPEEIVRRDAGSAAAAVRQAATPTPTQTDPTRGLVGLDAYVRSVAEGCPVVLDLDVIGDPRRADASASTTDALVRATRELLRNVKRHSGTQRAVLRIDFGARALEIRVVDHGTGSGDALVPGFGLQSSVIGPLQREGISVRFEQTEGGGVTVVMTVPRQGQDRTDRLAQSYWATMSASLAKSPSSALVLPIGAAYSYIAVRNTSTWSSPTTSLLVLLGFMVLLAVIVRRLRSSPPSYAWLGVVTASLLALTGVGMAGAPDGAMLDFRGWPVGYAAVIVAVILPVIPSWTGMVVLVPFPMLVVIAQWREPGLSGGAVPWSALNAAAMLPLGLLAVGAALRRVGRRVEADQQTTARLWLEDAGRQAAAWVSDVHLAHTRERVLPWLASIAARSVAIGEPRTVATAEVLGLEVRDDLYAPGFFDADLREAVSQFRRRGGQVRIRPAQITEQASREVASVLRAVVDRLIEPCRITLSFGSDGGAHHSRWRLAMVPPADETVKELALMHHVESDDDRTVIMDRGVGPT